MGCKGLCKDIIADQTGRALEETPNVRRCSTCNIPIAMEFWVKGKSGRIRCPCCNFQLRIHSRGNKARKRRQDEFALRTQ
jgi:hypothetical protein